MKTKQFIDINQININKFGTQLHDKTTTKHMQTKNEHVFFKIIAPNYNNMPYIKKCLDSVFAQTFRDFKLILVDDLSTDMSDKFCEMYARNHSDKMIYHQLSKKGYAGTCRNWAIDYPIDSEYTIFIDTDDWLFDDNVLQSLYDFIIQRNRPMLIRATMWHYFGNTKPGWKDHLRIQTKTEMYRDGPGPGRTIISSQLKYKFAENRSKSNDCIWFLRCIDKLQLDQIALYNKVWYVYNRASTTSCQNNEEKINNINCIYDSTVGLINDIKNEEFSDIECIQIKQWEIQRRLARKPSGISLLQILLNSYVIVCSDNEYKDFCTLFSSYNISPLPQPFIGCTDPDLFSNSWRIRRSHINLVRYAKNKNLPFVLIFESDAYPCIDILDKLDRYINVVPSDANLVLLGWTKIYKKTNYMQPFTKISNEIIDGAHSYIVFNRAYDRWLQLMENKKSKNSKDNYIYPPDNFIFNDIQNAYIIDYPLFIQYNKAKSSHGHIEYNFNGCSNIAPKGFK